VTPCPTSAIAFVRTPIGESTSLFSCVNTSLTCVAALLLSSVLYLSSLATTWLGYRLKSRPCARLLPSLFRTPTGESTSLFFLRQYMSDLCCSFVLASSFSVFHISMSPYPYSAYYLFRDDPLKRTFYIGVNAKDLQDKDLYGVKFDEPFPIPPSQLWLCRPSALAYLHCLQVAVVNRSDRPPGPCDQGCFGLSDDHRRAWKALEKHLGQFANNLFAFAKKHNGVKFVKAFTPFPPSCLPSAWKYDADYPTKHEAVQALHRSFTGFQWLMALVSYGIVLARREEDNLGHPGWAIFLQDECGVDAVFVDAIKASPLNSFTQRRVGAFVREDLIDPAWASHIRYMERGFCPIYIHWPQSTSWSGPFQDVMNKYRPTKEIMDDLLNPWQAAMRRRPPSPSALSSSTHDQPASSVATTVDGDAVDVFRDQEDDYDDYWESAGISGQRPGEYMDDFFTRQKVENLRKLSMMSAEGHQAVLDRQTNSLKGYSGGKRAAKVYVWIENRITSWIKRVWVTKAYAEQAFSSFNDSTRHFDAVNNCWDCYSGWAPGTAPDGDLDDSDDDFDMRKTTPVPLAPPSPPSVGGTHTPAASTPPSSTSALSLQPIADNDDVMGDPALTPPSSTSPLPSSQPIADNDDVMGDPALTPPSSTSALPSSQPIADNDDVMGDPVLTLPSSMPSQPITDNDDVMGDTATTYTAPPSCLPCHIPIVDSFQEAFVDTLCFRYGFVDDIAEVEDGGIEDKKVFDHAKRAFAARYDDLPPKYHRQFLKFVTMLSAGHTDPRLWDLDPSSPRRLHLPPTSNNDVFGINCLRDAAGDVQAYHIMPPSQQKFGDQYYYLVVPAASTALESYRRNFSSITFAAQRLVECGKPFRTLMAPTRDGRYSRPRLLLPHRAKSFKFNYDNYLAYENELDRLFQYPHARAALLEGGIVWRLAMEHIEAQDALNGPSDSAHDFGEVFTLSDGTKFMDDCLVDTERDFICGTYIVYTGMFIYVLHCFAIKRLS
jgi:hypothetical protein